MGKNQPSKVPTKIGDRTTSDVVVRLRTEEGRDDRFYCHSEILKEECKYFADRLSEDWPTCQILGSRYCVEVYCKESDFNSHVSTLRLLYAREPLVRHGVRSTLGILAAATHLGCHRLAGDCVGYLESAPWDEADEEEILRTVPNLGSQCSCILARLYPIDTRGVTEIFVSTFHFATSCTSSSLRELKSSVQDQLDYMLTEDDDTPLLSLNNDSIKREVMHCVRNLLTRFDNLIESLSASDMSRKRELNSVLSDISWVCQILNKMEMMKEFVYYWVRASSDIARVSEQESLETRLKVVEVTAKVLEAVGFGHVVVPAERRFGLMKVWIPFASCAKAIADQADSTDEDFAKFVVDGEVWQGLESAVVSTVLTLPSGWQAEILAEWLGPKHARYPDLTEAFEVWCYRSKVAKRRLQVIHGMNLG